LPHSLIEEKLFKSNFKKIAGVDEVGRGSIAGPVVSAAVILEKKLLLNNPLNLNDSKKISQKRRKELFNIIINSDSQFSIGISTNNEIDNLGIVQSTKNSMLRALSGLDYDCALVDAVNLDINKTNFYFYKADTISTSVAAASIIAKVSRDSLMENIYDKLFPNYFFINNKGYGSKKHIDAVKKIGLSLVHRKTFKPNSELI
tara:strand:- start:205 stop:810 length:606 start_codon:yes stop_codon:yes gene_type:complete